MIIIGIPIGTTTTLLADKIIILIFGTGYTQSITALQILIWTLVFTFGGASFVRLLEATQRQLVLSKITGISVILNLLLNLILIPKFSLIGACIATVLTEIFLVSVVFRICYQLGYGIKIKKISTDLFKIIFASLIMGFIIYCIKDLNLLLILIVSILVYFPLLYLVGGIDKVDIKIIKEMIK